MITWDCTGLSNSAQSQTRTDLAQSTRLVQEPTSENPGLWLIEMQKVNTFTIAARIKKFTPKLRDSRQIQRYQKCMIRDVSVWNTRKQWKIPENSMKQSQTETLLVFNCCHKHLTFIYTTLHYIFTPLAPFCISGLTWLTLVLWSWPTISQQLTYYFLFPFISCITQLGSKQKVTR